MAGCGWREGWCFVMERGAGGQGGGIWYVSRYGCFFGV